MVQENAQQRTALVTGGSAGIGLATVRVLQREGYRVAAIARNTGPLDVLQESGVIPLPCDVADERDVAHVGARIASEFGRLDVLVNGAGIVANGAIDEISAEQVHRLFAVNLLGSVWMCRAMAPLLRASKGAIVNFSSGIASRPLSGTSIYAATKGGIESFTRALALELGPSGVRVNAVAPSLVRSEIWVTAGMNRAQYEQMLVSRGSEYPLGRVGEPEDVAEMVGYLVSDRAAWITGAVIPIDGGSTLGVARR